MRPQTKFYSQWVGLGSPESCPPRLCVTIAVTLGADVMFQTLSYILLLHRSTNASHSLEAGLLNPCFVDKGMEAHGSLRTESIHAEHGIYKT